MTFYLVRSISRKNLVGLFFAESVPHLVVSASKVANTEDCEFIEMPGGGIYWPASDVSIPLKEGEALPWQSSRLTPDWENALRAQDAAWMSLLTPQDAVS